MEVNDFKLYSAKVANGSGVLFQPMNECDYTYILTAKHILFEDIEDERGCLKKNLLNEINIYIQTTPHLIKLELKININYFPHKIADIAILKIGYLKGFENIFINSNFKDLSNSFICGYPGYRNEKPNLDEKYTNYGLNNLIDSREYFCKGQLLRETIGQNEIKGLSGGGIMRLELDNLSLIGIQSEVASQIPNGQIEFIPIKYFDDIINYPDNEGKLSELLPPYMGAFKYLNDEIIKLEEALNPNLVGKIKSAFNEQMKFIGLTPFTIYKSRLNQKLLADLNSNFFSKKLWISWLEYLTILSFIENKEINLENIENLFNRKRLVHSDTDSNWLEIIPDILKNCLVDVENNATLIISTKNSPLTLRRFNNKVIPNICSGRRSLGQLQIDQANRINSIKEIIHINAFESDCILQSQESFNNISELDIKGIIDELKLIINEFF